MTRKLMLSCFFALSSFILSAQMTGITGNLLDVNDKSPVTGATVTLTSTADSLFRINYITGSTGGFVFDNLAPGSYTIRVSSIGYEPVARMVRMKDSTVKLGNIPVLKEAKLLDEVIVQAPPVPVKQKADTIEYSANAFKVNPDADAQDLIRKMPGITVEDGAVKAGGEEVKKVTVDGRDFFGDDATAALKNLPAEVIDKIQVFDRLSDQAKFTGFEDANTTKSLNIITKSNMRNGQFGRVYAGYGTDERYSAGGNVSFFNGKRRISLVGLANNVNQQNFASEDLLGISSNQTRGGGGGGRGRGGQGGGSSNFLVGQQGGISRSNALGINFSNAWGKKTEITGSYFFNNANNTSDNQVNRQFFLSGDSTQFYNEKNLASSKNNNHRVNLRIEFKLDSSNTLLITPNISFQENHSFSSLTGINSFKGNAVFSQSLSNNTRDASGYSMNNGILFRHAFNKRGRTFSIGLNTGLNNRSGENYLQAVNNYYQGSGNTDSLLQFTDQQTDGYQISTNFAYTEPIGKRGQLQFNYNPSWTKNNSGQQTFQYDLGSSKYSLFDTSLSNRFNNTYNTENGGASYRIGNRDNMFSLGMAYQQAKLSGDQVFPFATEIKRSFSNLLPNAMLRKKLSEKSNIRIFYRSSTTAPSVSQLQEVINNSNPLFLRTGNPNLDQQYTHRLVSRYTYTNSAKGQSFLANMFLEKTNKYIGNATYIASADSIISPSITLYKGSQLTRPANMNGYWSVRSFFTFGMPLKFIKTNLNWNAGYAYVKTPGLINSVNNLSNAQNYNLGAVIASNISEFVDFTFSYSANFNKVKNSIQPSLNNNYFSQVAGFQLSLLSKNGWTFQNDLNNRLYSGLTDGFNQNFWLWNMSAGKKFLKDQKGELRLSVFDLLNQNRSVTRNATETYIEDVQTQVLQQYFMLTFSYRLRNFGAKR